LRPGGVCQIDTEILHASVFQRLEERGVIFREPPDTDDPFINAVAFPSRPKLQFTFDVSVEDGIENCALEELSNLKNREMALLSKAYDHVELCLCSGLSSFAFERNRLAHENKNSIFFVMNYETFIRVGPLIIPGESACLECIHWRSRAAAKSEANWLKTTELFSSLRRSPTSCQLQAQIGFIEISKIIFGVTGAATPNRFYDLSLLDWKRSENYILKFDKCPICGS
jgi:hypothetical protein